MSATTTIKGREAFRAALTAEMRERATGAEVYRVVAGFAVAGRGCIWINPLPTFFMYFSVDRKPDDPPIRPMWTMEWLPDPDTLSLGAWLKANGPKPGECIHARAMRSVFGWNGHDDDVPYNWRSGEAAATACERGEVGTMCEEER